MRNAGQWVCSRRREEQALAWWPGGKRSRGAWTTTTGRAEENTRREQQLTGHRQRSGVTGAGRRDFGISGVTCRDGARLDAFEGSRGCVLNVPTNEPAYSSSLTCGSSSRRSLAAS
jgi:hypothetical protein